MWKLIAGVVLMLSPAASAAAFDYGRYEESSIEELIESASEFDIHEAGQSVVMPPRPVHLYTAIHRYPKPCSGELPTLLLSAIGISEAPQMNWCMVARGESGQTVNLWVQDSFAPRRREEYELGDGIELWALWLFVNASDRKPYFIVNAIGPAITPPSESPDGT